MASPSAPQPADPSPPTQEAAAEECKVSELNSKPPPPKYSRVMPRPNQAVGPTGAQIGPHICKILIEAVKSGDLQKFNQECSNYHVELRDVISDPAQFSQSLHFSATAIQNEDLAIQFITILIESGVDLFQKDNLKQTPLFYACRDGKIKLAQFLIEQGLSVQDIDTYGQNAFFYAVNLGHIEVCKLLKSYGSEHDHIDDFQQTPMFYAIKSNKLSIFEWLITLGVDLKITDRRGQGLLNHAIRYNRQQMKETLMKQGAPSAQNKDASKSHSKKPQPIPQQKQRVNERLQPKKYVLQVFDGSQYRPISQEEFEQMAKDHPEISKLFEDENEVQNI